VAVAPHERSGGEEEDEGERHEDAVADLKKINLKLSLKIKTK
jgi:hypothetical protein